MNFTQNDQFLMLAATTQVQKWMKPVPFFVLRPGLIHKQNKQVVFATLNTVLADPELENAVGVEPEKCKHIMLNVAHFEIWKRGWVMRAQWLFQVLATIILVKIIWLIL